MAVAIKLLYRLCRASPGRGGRAPPRDRFVDACVLQSCLKGARVWKLETVLRVKLGSRWRLDVRRKNPSAVLLEKDSALPIEIEEHPVYPH